MSNNVPPLNIECFLSANRSADTPDVEPRQVAGMLESISAKKATGSDGLEGWLLKEHAFLIAEPICKLFNECLSQRRFPTAKKIDTVKSLPKTTPNHIADCRPISLTPNHIADYRPISLTPILSRVFEIVNKEWLMTSIGHKLDPHQYA